MSEELDTIFNDDVPAGHRSGVIAVVGRPNVGKSTLLNAILGQKVAIVSPRPQTTRRQQPGIYTVLDAQLILIDTPGLHKPQHKLGEYMVESAERALHDADLVLWVLDASGEPMIGDQYIAQTLQKVRTPVILALNKIDAAPDAAQDANIAPLLELIEHVEAHRVSALTGQGVPDLIKALIARMPEGPRYYPIDQLSTVNLRFIAAETIREKIMLHTEKEVPHAVAVDVDEYKERPDGTHYISATIYVERDSQKAIIVGKGGAMVKQIGTEARQELEASLNAKVFLDLHVKVLKNWRSDERLMKRMGYFLPKEENE